MTEQSCLFFCWKVNEVPGEVPHFPVARLHWNAEGRTAARWAGHTHLSYFYYHRVLDVSCRPKPCFGQCAAQPQNWKICSYRLGKSSYSCLLELQRPCRRQQSSLLASHGSGTALGEALAECKGKGFAAVLALRPGLHRAREAKLAHTRGLASIPSSDQKQIPRRFCRNRAGGSPPLAPPSTLPTPSHLQSMNFLVWKQFLHIWTPTAFLCCEFPRVPLRPLKCPESVASRGCWQGGREWRAVCLILIWLSVPSTGSWCLLISSLASP